jgi:hypothetical protein
MHYRKIILMKHRQPTGLKHAGALLENLQWTRQEFCVNGRSFPCAAGILGGGKVGILILDFHFSTAHSSSWFWPAYLNWLVVFGAFGAGCDSGGSPTLSMAPIFRFTPERPAEPGRPAESRSAAAPPSSSAPAWSTFWLCAPAPETVTSAPLPDSGTILSS